MVQHADRQAVDLVLLGPGHGLRAKDLTLLIKGTVIHLDDAEVLAEGLLVGGLGLLGQLVVEGAVEAVLLVVDLGRGVAEVVEVGLAELGLEVDLGGLGGRGFLEVDGGSGGGRAENVLGFEV